jgi:hypothetical protein
MSSHGRHVTKALLMPKAFQLLMPKAFHCNSVPFFDDACYAGSHPYKVNTAAGPLNTCIDTLYQPLSEYTLEYMYYNTFHPDGHTTPTWRSNLCPRTPLTLFGHEL